MIQFPYYIDLLGKAFEYGGRGPEQYDCYGLAIELYRRCNISLPDYMSSDNPIIQSASFEHGADRFFDQVIKPEPMGLITFQILPKYVTHCGIYVGNGKFIHIMSKIKVAIEELNNDIWKHRQRGIYRFRGIE